MMGGRTITIAQQKGGSGKTTLAVTLATALLARGQRVALLDTDPQGSLGRWFMARRTLPGHTDEALEFSTASAWGVAYEVEKLARSADVVIVDTPPKADADLRPALRAADLVLVPVATSQVDLWATEGVLDLCRRESRPAAIVMTRARPGTRLGDAVSAAARDMDAELLDTPLGNRIAYAETLGLGLGAAEGGRVTAPLRAEVAALTEAVMAVLNR
jgi:chromosome partitioning protein